MTKAAADIKKVGADLTEGPILKAVITFAVPIILTNVVQQMYSLVDLMVIGRYMGSIGTVGVSTGGELADLVAPVAQHFATGGQIVIAQLMGARMMSEIKKCTGTLITAMLGLSLLLELVSLLFCIPMLNLLHCPEEAMAEAARYMRITSLGYPFIFAYNAVCGVLRGMGESKRPLYFVIVAAIINIFLDILFVALFHMGAAGTAVATIFSQMGSFFAAFTYLYKRREQFDFEMRLSYFRIDKKLLKTILSISLPECGRSLCVHFSLMWVNAGINSFGLVASSTNSVGNKIQKFLQVFVQSLAQSAGAIVGQNLGAGKQDRAADVAWCTFGLSTLMACVLGLVSWFFPRQFFSIFTIDPDVIEYGVIFMHIIIHYFASAFTASFQSIPTGCGFASFNFAVGILDGVVCRVGLSILFVYILDMGATGFFWAMSLTRVLPGIIVFCYFMSGKWRYRKLLTG